MPRSLRTGQARHNGAVRTPILAVTVVGVAVLLISSVGDAQRQMPPAWPYGMPPLPPGVVPDQVPAQRTPPAPDLNAPPPPAGPLRQAKGSTLQFTTPEGPDWLAAVQAAALIVTGVSVLAAAAVDLYRRRDAGSVLLAAWVAGTFVFATYLNWSVTARTLLPMAPAVAILIVRRLEDRGALPRQDRKSQNAQFVRWTHRFDLRIDCALLASAVIPMEAALTSQ